MMERLNTTVCGVGLFLGVVVAGAFPPAPHHEIYGSVRDSNGDPISLGAMVTLAGGAGKELMSGAVDPGIDVGVNYSLKVPMDAGTVGQLYQPSALAPAMPFTLSVKVGEVEHVPIEVKGGLLSMGKAGGRTRLDLTLGVDGDGDGLPDAWEQEVVDLVDGIDGIDAVTRDGDADGDGVSNYTEYLAGTYAFDRRAVFRLDIISVSDGVARLRFLGVSGRSYRLTAHGDDEGFTPTEFRTTSSGSSKVAVWRAETTRFQDVYVDVGERTGQLFKLHVE